MDLKKQLSAISVQHAARRYGGGEKRRRDERGQRSEIRSQWRGLKPISDVRLLTSGMDAFNALTIRLVDQGTLWGKLKADG
jgi:hypothetical protein